MKLGNSYFYTIRENLKDEDSVSGNLLARSGMIKKSSSGVYMYMPLGLKVLQNISEIIREEMNKTNAQEVLMPSLIPEEVYEASGRRQGFGSSMFSLKDRFNKPFVLGPTHEELFAVAASMKIRSYKDLPFNLYQFQNKFRDEPRPRFGLIRVREFIMKDAYSFDIDENGLNVSYQKMFDAYKASFDRMKLNYSIVKADTGIMGGLLSEEFQALSPIGEDTLVICDDCGYACNIEIAECKDDSITTFDKHLPLTLVKTPNAKTISEVANFLNLPANKFVKTMIYRVDDMVVACLIRGDKDINEVKIQKLFNATKVELADSATVELITKASVGFAGPVGLDIPVILDKQITHMHNFIVGANKNDHHYINVNLADFSISKIADIRLIQEGDQCIKCGGSIHFEKGIEIGNTFKLGTKYAKAMDLMYLDQNNQLQEVWMGSYGIGPGRCMAALAEQFNDDKGLIWPMNVAPYKVCVVIINVKDHQQLETGERIYDELNKLNISVILDDRDERAGVKFNDMDLIGIPIRITVGKALINNEVEIKLRDQKDIVKISLDDYVGYVQELISNE
ncbi:MAG: proline--tRNA ligase [Erysipelotrichaceae bacterium]|nr:proline--tRNA ligase [Erysipelotrichaceae bacterium]MDD3923629.1 proline--tRNA ligase [Erysipelotrichaceae bacterium]MDD4641984.1 proline--tRNA ligase [Erysipelotrichaceae bacterium]